MQLVNPRCLLTDTGIGTRHRGFTNNRWEKNRKTNHLGLSVREWGTSHQFMANMANWAVNNSTARLQHAACEGSTSETYPAITIQELGLGQDPYGSILNQKIIHQDPEIPSTPVTTGPTPTSECWVGPPRHMTGAHMIHRWSQGPKRHHMRAGNIWK